MHIMRLNAEARVCIAKKRRYYVCVFILVKAYSHESPLPAQQSKSMVDSHVQPGVAPHLVGSVMEQQLEEHFFAAKGLKMRLGPGWILVQLKTE